MTKPRLQKRKKDVQMSKSSGSAEFEIRNADRMNLLDELAKRPHTFETAGRFGAVWDALLADWIWEDMNKGPADFGALALEKGQPWVWPNKEDRAAHVEHIKKMDTLAKKWVELTLEKEVIKACRDLIKEKLDEKGPKNGDPDLRWRGTIALDQRKLYDRLQFIVEGAS